MDDGFRAAFSVTVPSVSARLSRYSWRFLVVCAALYVVITALAKVKLAIIGVFVALVMTALLRPMVEMFARRLPRWAAVVLTMLIVLAVVVGLIAFVTANIAGESGRLSAAFQSGSTELLDWLSAGPLRLSTDTIEVTLEQGRRWVAQHEQQLAGQLLGGAATAGQFVTGLMLATFCAVFFLSSGPAMWSWALNQLPEQARGTWDASAQAAWQTFEGYTKGTILVSVSNAVLVTLALWALRVPLALPLGLLVFLASFIPLVGGVFSVAIAAVVAFAFRGPAIALIVVILIPIIGQIEGHVLQPLIMSRSVRLHPVVVVLAVVCGGFVGGLLGAVLSVPVIAVGWSVLSSLRSRITDRTGDPRATAR